MVNVIGLGYIGMPTALMLATHGIDVVGSDYNTDLIGILQNGKTTFKEKGLDILLKDAIKAGIQFTNKYKTTDCYIISVPTPYDKFSKKIDVTYIIHAVESILEIAPLNAVLIIESTVSPGTIDKYIRPMINNAGRTDLNLAHAPERIIPGNMIYELLHNNRTIGADNPQIGEKIKKLYSSFCDGEIIVTDIRTAEMSKVVENTYRAVNIAFANELAKICRYNEMNIYEIIRICNMHPRVNILQPGPGVGGHCISVDPWFLVGDYPKLTKVIAESMEINASMPSFVLQRIYDILKKHDKINLERVGLYGLTYKENVDDTRESPTLQLLELQKRHLGIPLKVYDPLVKQNIVPNQYHNLCDFLNDIDMIIIMTGHNEIKENQDKLSEKIILDTRNVVSQKNVYHL